MSMLRRVSALLVTIVMTLAFVGFGATAPAEAATKPTITELVVNAGPLKSTRIVIRGTSLKSVNAIEFGKKRGTIVRKISSTAIEVKTPSGAKAGTVYVRVRAGNKWSAKTSKSRYTFVPTPKITKLSARRGTFVGGQKIEIAGSGLALTSAVSFGAANASIVSKKASSVTVKTPAGVLGASEVRVTTPGGRSKALTFTYVRPADVDKSALTPVAAATQAADVDWVTGGPDPDGDPLAPWTVGLPSGSTVPAIGSLFVIKPGNPAFVTGLSGTISDVAVQGDDSVRVQVSPTDLRSTFDRLTLEYSGRPDLSRRVSARGRESNREPTETETSRRTEFSIKGLNPVKCVSSDGASVAFTVELSMTLTDVDVSQRFDLGGIGHAPSFDASLSTEIKTTGKISVAAKATCKLNDSWVRVNSKLIPLGATGMTISFAPSFEFKASAKGTWSIVDRSRSTYSLRAEYGKPATVSEASRSVENRQGGESSFKAEVAAGVAVQAGILDRAGFQGKILLGVAAELKAAQNNICVEGKLFLRLTIGFFLDVFIARWEEIAFEGTIDFFPIKGCVLPEAPVPGGEPDITSGRLPDATLGESYSARLKVADDRSGTWSVVRGLPSGLRVDADGSITGTPTDRVGDYPVIVDFRDAGGKVATATVRIMVQPPRGIRGGNLQITLQWTGPADLDLHVTDPTGDEIYYRNPSSESGGQLDKDANAGCNGVEDDDNAVENVYWPPRTAPTGSYLIWVHTYDECGGPLDWRLTVRRNGAIVLDERGVGDSDGYVVVVGGQSARLSKRTVADPDRDRTYPSK